MAGPGPVARERRGGSFPEARIPVKRRRNWAALRAASVLLILGLWLALSVRYDYLFFREWLVASSLIGMAVLLNAVRRPAIIISGEDGSRAHPD